MGGMFGFTVAGDWLGATSPFSLTILFSNVLECDGVTDLSESFCLLPVFFLFGLGILHSILKATQLVHGTPRLAASQRTYYDNGVSFGSWFVACRSNLSGMACL